MRIQDTQPNVQSSLAAAVESTRQSDAKATAAATARGRTVDEVQLSAGAQFASSTIADAKNSPNVRPEVVARAEALLAAGVLGKDAGKLADTLIDAALNDSFHV
jgi:anti-sigma28 factor (negative regulator of flagellin synthesis)